MVVIAGLDSFEGSADKALVNQSIFESHEKSDLQLRLSVLREGPYFSIKEAKRWQFHCLKRRGSECDVAVSPMKARLCGEVDRHCLATCTKVVLYH
jgi:hypothetical protein